MTMRRSSELTPNLPTCTKTTWQLLLDSASRLASRSLGSLRRIVSWDLPTLKATTALKMIGQMEEQRQHLVPELDLLSVDAVEFRLPAATCRECLPKIRSLHCQRRMPSARIAMKRRRTHLPNDADWQEVNAVVEAILWEVALPCLRQWQNRRVGLTKKKSLPKVKTGPLTRSYRFISSHASRRVGSSSSNLRFGSLGSAGPKDEYSSIQEFLVVGGHEGVDHKLYIILSTFCCSLPPYNIIVSSLSMQCNAMQTTGTRGSTPMIMYVVRTPVRK
jgi:hypothetical protein